MSIPATIANAVQTTQQWLNELCETGDLSDTGEAVAVLRETFSRLLLVIVILARFPMSSNNSHRS